jgi:tRNA(Ile)-lysidine synthase
VGEARSAGRPERTPGTVIDLGPAATLLGRCTFPGPGTAVTCGVSGGADSLALLVLAVAAGCVVTAVHVDHGLRAGSAAEADLVATVAGRFGARFRAETVTVAQGPNLEARARAARHAVLPAGCLLGHTADDRAETLLLNLLRGAGLHGLGSLRADDRHPILGLRRVETAALCADLGLRPFIDPTNTDLSRRRNRVRHEVLPLLAEVAARDVVPVLCRTAALAAEVADHVDAEADGLDVAEVAALRAAPEAVVAAALRRWLRTCSPEGHPPDAATLARVLEVVHGEARGTDVGGGWRVARRGGRLRLEPPVGG